MGRHRSGRRVVASRAISDLAIETDPIIYAGVDRVTSANVGDFLK